MFLATLLLILGIMAPLLLNGQTFTNSIIGIICLSASIAMCRLAEYRSTADSEGGTSRRLVAGLAVLVIAFLLVQLPANYEFQSPFNQTMERIRVEKQTPEQSTDQHNSIP